MHPPALCPHIRPLLYTRSYTIYFTLCARSTKHPLLCTHQRSVLCAHIPEVHMLTNITWKTKTLQQYFDHSNSQDTLIRGGGVLTCSIQLRSFAHSTLRTHACRPFSSPAVSVAKAWCLPAQPSCGLTTATTQRCTPAGCGKRYMVYSLDSRLAGFWLQVFCYVTAE